MAQWIEVDVKGQKVKVFAEKIGKTLWYHYQGEVLSYTPEVKRRGGSSVGGSENIIKAPMPGKILKISKTTGTKVSPGELIISMEAMKMEYSLSVGVEGVISSIAVSEGDLVSLGQILVEVEAEDEKN